MKTLVDQMHGTIERCRRSMKNEVNLRKYYQLQKLEQDIERFVDSYLRPSR